MDRALGFYEAVLAVPPAAVSPGWSTFELGGFTLALHIIDRGTAERPIPHAGLNLLVDDIEAMQAQIEARGGRLVELHEPDVRVPVRVAAFVDCEGNGFELRQEPRHRGP